MPSLFQTYIGTLLVSVNPYKDLGIYTKKQMDIYMGVNFFELPPHMWVGIHVLGYTLVTGNDVADLWLMTSQTSHHLFMQLRPGWQCLSCHADGDEQSFLPYFRGEWSRQDRSLQKDPAVLCSQLSNLKSPGQHQGPDAGLQSSAGGQGSPARPMICTLAAPLRLVHTYCRRATVCTAVVT